MVKYEPVGDEVQYLKVTLQDGESVFVEPGHLIYKSSEVHIDAQAGGLHGSSRPESALRDANLVPLHDHVHVRVLTRFH